MRDDTEDALMAQMTRRIHSLLSIVDLKGGTREEINQKGKEKLNNGALTRHNLPFAGKRMKQREPI